MDLARVLKHLFVPGWVARRAFPAAVLARIEDAVRESERTHRGELRFVAEGDLDLLPLLRGLTARERALEVFAGLGVWDTAENSGVLVYVQLVDHRIEIVADRGIAARVAQSDWDAVCRRMETAFRGGDYEGGALSGIREITALLARHFPPGAANPDELPDRPVVL
jgi:uncharacterized membrane protein